MSEKRVAVNRRDDSRSKKEWGDTRSGGPGRVVHVSGFPRYATVEDFRQFFEACGELEGVQIKEYDAFVQFSRPKGAQFAISRSREKFMGQFSIIISQYRERAPPPPRRDERVREYRSRTIHIDPSWSPERRLAERKRQTREASEDNPRKSIRRHHSDSSARSRDEFKSPPTKDHRSESTSELRRDLYSSTSSESNPFLDPANFYPVECGGLPVDIELTLRLVLEHKSARTLSLSQINNIIVFFKSEQVILSTRNKTFASQNLPLQQFQIQPTASIFNSHAKQHPPQQPLQQPMHSSSKEPSPKRPDPPKESDQSSHKSIEPSNGRSSASVSTNKEDPGEVPQYIKNFGKLLRKATS